MNERNRDGITLVALVITIIVLLIMAGVSIALVVGDNGILSKAKEAKTGNIVAEETEQVNLAYSSALTKNLGAAVTAENLQEELDESVGNGKTTVTVDGNSLKVLFNETEHSYNVNNGRVTEGTNGTTALTDLEKLRIYFGKGPEEFWDEENDNYKDIDPIPDASTSINEMDNDFCELISVYNDYFIKYNNNYYRSNNENFYYWIDDNYIIEYNNSYYGVHYDTWEVSLFPSSELAQLTDLERLQLYYWNALSEYSWWNLYDDENQAFRNIDPIMDASTSVIKLSDYDVEGRICGLIVQYNDNYYLMSCVSDDDKVLLIEKTFGIYNIEGNDVLVTPSTPENLLHATYYGPSTEDDNWHLYIGDTDELEEEPFVGGYVTTDYNHVYVNPLGHSTWLHYYDANGNPVRAGGAS